MSSMRTSALLVILIGASVSLGALASTGALSQPAAAAASDVREVRWLLSHQPTDVFARAADVFAQKLYEESGGTLALRVVMPEEVGVTNGDVPNAEVFRRLANGDVEIATAYTVALGYKDPNLWAVNLPMLFADASVVSQVLDGTAGEALFAGLPETWGVEGLAFTMSGGYRIIASKNTAVASVDDLKGKRIATSGGPVAEATLSALGAIPVPTDLESGNVTLDANTIDGVEITYSRLAAVVGGESQYTKFINETNHSVFLTAILADTRFFALLSPQQQAALKNAALAAAQIERADSLALGESVKTQLAQTGSTITTLSQAAADDFAEKTRTVYDVFLPMFTFDVTAQLQ